MLHVSNLKPFLLCKETKAVKDHVYTHTYAYTHI